MSYDIFVQDLPQDARAIEDIPADFRPAPIGKRSTIIEQIKEVVPTADFSNPSWGRIRGDDWFIEINIDVKEDCDGFAFHVRGGSTAIGVIAAILERLKLRALDPQQGGLFVAGPEAIEEFRKWRAYRDQVVNDKDRSFADIPQGRLIVNLTGRATSLPPAFHQRSGRHERRPTD